MKYVSVILPLFFVVTMETSARADSVRFHGVVTDYSFDGGVDPFPFIKPGASIFVGYEFDPATPDSDPSPVRGQYDQPPVFPFNFMEVLADNSSVGFNLPGPLSLVVENDALGDRFRGSSTIESARERRFFEFDLFGDPNIFSDDSLPAAFPNWREFSFRSIVLERESKDSRPSFRIEGTFDEGPIPEPSTLALVALGVGVLMRRRKRAA